MPTAYTCTTGIPLLRMFFSCICLHSYDPMVTKNIWNARQRRIIRNVHRFFSGFDPAQPEALKTGNAPDQIPHATRKRNRMFPRDDVEEANITVVPERLPKRSQKEQVLVPRSTVMKRANTSKPGMPERDEEEVQTEDEENFDEKQAAVLPSMFNEQALFEKNVLSNQLRNKRTPAD